MAKDFLTENKIKFEEVNVETDEKAVEEMIEKSGQTGVPVLDINGTVIIGFDVDRIKKALKLK
jgi:glutaredoxin